MQSKVRKSFWKKFQSLPETIQKKAKEGYEKWKKNPYDPSLGFSLLEKSKITYRVDIGRNYRALGVKPQHEDTIYWYFIGTHEDYNEEIKNAK